MLKLKELLLQIHQELKLQLRLRSQALKCTEMPELQLSVHFTYGELIFQSI